MPGWLLGSRFAGVNPPQHHPGQHGEYPHQPGTMQAELKVDNHAAQTGGGIAPDGQLDVGIRRRVALRLERRHRQEQPKSDEGGQLFLTTLA